MAQAPFRSMTERPTTVRYWVIVFAVALAVVTYVDRVAISSAAPSIQHDLGLTKVEMGWVFTAFGLAYAMFEMPGGYMGDWMGPRKVLMRIVLWWSFFTAATGWAWNLPSLLVTRFLFGAGEAGCFPNVTKAFSTWLPEEEKTRAQSIMWLSARWGGAFTPPLVVWVMIQVGWRHSFELFGILGVIWAVFFYRWYRNDPLKNPKLNAAERELLKHSAKHAEGHGDVPWVELLASQQVWMLCWQYFCLSYGWYFYITWLPTYLREARHLTLTSSAWLGVLPLFCGGIGNPVGSFLTSRLTPRTGLAQARRLVAYIGFTGAAGFLILSTYVGDPLFAMLSIGMASFCNDLVMPGTWAAAMDVGGKYAGTLSGAMNMWGNVGGLLCPLAIGYLLKWTGNNWNVTFYVSAGIYLAGILFWRFLDPVTPLQHAE
ncbi:MAG TPA: MFS transporter [Candidatus Sulfopaludibacter sp.]|nr:MFS transporter [Candidatus Sulfopaludibacter sp.]